MATKTRIEVRPLTGALGAEIFGVDIAKMDDATFDEIYDAFLEHLVIFFRDQDITPEQQLAFAHRFGEIHTHPYMKGLDDYPEILEIVKEPKDTYTFGNIWHTDQMFTPKPAKATILYAKETPAAGGDTMFANMYMAYDCMSEPMKSMLSGVKTFNAGAKRKYNDERSRAERYKGTSAMADKVRDPGNLITESAHPVIRTHPETGKKSLYIGSHTQSLDGFSDEESAPMVDYLQAYSTKPDFTCRFRWAPGSMAIWDNRCTQHLALADYNGHRRCMHRITICGDEPF
ncbi:MAG: TauD/TfdA family dioxygenase [Rhodospirillales bacterium]|nr:TauD/TfdA family dioxygenase [Rhodospirillales bacterium]